MLMKILPLASLCFSLAAQTVNAQAVEATTANEKATNTTIDVETTRIKASKEQPNVLYVVPWKEMENSKNNEQKLILHDFFGDLYDPVLPAYSETSEAELPEKNK